MQTRRLLVVMAALLLPVSLIAAPPDEKWVPVPPVDFSKIRPADFSDDELDLPFYLEHFHTVANSIIETGDTRGFIGANVWRGGHDTFNARVLENYTSLAFFYCADRPWNPYHGSPAVRQRLEALLTYWAGIQGPNGEFSEYEPKKWGLAPTAFATKFMGRALELLHDGPPIDPALLKRITDADRKAIVASLTLPDFYKHGRSFTNQFANVFGGAAAYLKLHPDTEIARLLDQAMRRAHDDFQSPAGFFFEHDGPDFGYTLHTHHSDMVQAYHHLRDTALGGLIEQEQQRWSEWLSYNLVREPEGSTFVINRGIECRQRTPTWTRLECPWGDRVPLARAFASSREEHEVDARAARAKMEREWPDFTPTRDGGGQLVAAKTAATRASRLAYTPYGVLDLAYREWYPSRQERDAVVATLPYLAKDQFTHQRTDSRYPLTCTYVRRPGYYAAFNAGTHRGDQQRFGLGLLWNPRAGAVLQSQTGTDDAAWGTRLPDQSAPVEAADLTAVTYSIANNDLSPTAGPHDLPTGDLTVTYSLGESGQKTLRFSDDVITVQARHAGTLTEQLPLLVQSPPHISPGRVTADYHGTTLTITFPPAVTATMRPTDTKIAGKTLLVLHLAATDELRYQVHFTDNR